MEGEVGELPCGAGSDSGDAHGGSRDRSDRGRRVRGGHRRGPAGRECGERPHQDAAEIKGWTWRCSSGFTSAFRCRWCCTGEQASARIALREAVALGVTKVNFGTYLKQRYLPRCARRSGTIVPTRIGCWGWAGARMCSWPGGWPCATPSSSGLICWDAAEKQHPNESRQTKWDSSRTAVRG